MAELKTLTFAQVAGEMIWQLEHPEELERRRVRTGLRNFDTQINPMRGELVLIGAENGSGKSVLVNTLCAQAAHEGKRTLLFSLEDSRMEIRTRMLGLAARVPPGALTRSQFSASEIEQLKRAVQRVKALPFRMVLNERNLDDILDTVEAVSRVDGVDIVVVDYLQALDGFSGAQDRRNQIRLMVQRLQKVAREHEVMLIVVSQIVRPDSRKIGEEPTRHWLKEASDIADAADKIVLLWRSQARGEGNRFGPTNIKCDKDKSGLASGWSGQLEIDPSSGAFREVHGG